MTESEILYAIRLALGTMPDVRLFRNNIGSFKDRTGRWVQYGLAPGSADLIGLRTVTITPEMVGREVALFIGIECKTDKGRISEEQESFLRMLEQRGALAGIARSVDDAKRIIAGTGGSL